MEATTVAALGQAETEFDLATFSLTLNATAGTVPAAKSLLAVSLAELNSTVDKVKTDLSLEFVKNSLRSSSSVDEKHEYDRKTNTNEFVGYTLNYSMSFDLSDLKKVDQVYDALTSLNNGLREAHLSVNAPSFSISLKTRERLNKKALKDAFQKVSERFETECQVLGLDVNTFEINSWEASYSDTNRSDNLNRKTPHTFAFAVAAGQSNTSDDGDVSFNTGLATVFVNLEVGFRSKN